MPRRPAIGMATLGTVAIVLSVVVMLFWYLGYAQKLLSDKGREITAEFSAVPQLQEGDPVKVDGRDEGRVQEIEQVDGGKAARVTFDVSEDAGPLYDDAVVQLRWKSLLGGSFYLEVDRGTEPAGPLSGTIPRKQTVQQVEVEDITTIFQGRVRSGLTTLPDELSRGLRDPQPVDDLLDQAQEDSPSLEAGLRAVRGQTPDVDLRNVITGTAATVTALDAPRDELRSLVAGAASLVGTTAGRQAELRSTLDAGPALTTNVRTTLARLDGTLEGADGLVRKLDVAADEIDPTLAALNPTLTRTARLLGSARPLLRTLRPTVRSLATLGRRGVPLLDGLQPSLDRLDDKILPFLSRKDPQTGKPTSAMIGGTAAGFGGSASQQDRNGHFIRFPASISVASSPSVYLPCQTALTDPTQAQALTCDGLDTALQEYLEYLPQLSNSPLTTKRKKGR